MSVLGLQASIPVFCFFTSQKPVTRQQQKFLRTGFESTKACIELQVLIF